MKNKFFIIGVPGADPKKAFELASRVAIGASVGIKDKYSFLPWKGTPFTSYDAAEQMAKGVIARGLEDPKHRIEAAICIRYMNASKEEEYLFFGWNDDDDQSLG